VVHLAPRGATTAPSARIDGTHRPTKIPSCSFPLNHSETESERRDFREQEQEPGPEDVHQRAPAVAVRPTGARRLARSEPTP